MYGRFSTYQHRGRHLPLIPAFRSTPNQPWGACCIYSDENACRHELLHQTGETGHFYAGSASRYWCL